MTLTEDIVNEGLNRLPDNMYSILVEFSKTYNLDL